MSTPGASRYANFEADPTTSLLDSFKQLAIQEGWSKKSKTYKQERKAFLAEVVEDRFLNTFGVNISSLQAWQDLCKTIGVPETKEGEEAVLLTSISACQAVCCCIFHVFHEFLADTSLCFVGPQRHLR